MYQIDWGDIDTGGDGVDFGITVEAGGAETIDFDIQVGMCRSFCLIPEFSSSLGHFSYFDPFGHQSLN